MADGRWQFPQRGGKRGKKKFIILYNIYIIYIIQYFVIKFRFDRNWLPKSTAICHLPSILPISTFKKPFSIYYY